MMNVCNYMFCLWVWMFVCVSVNIFYMLCYARSYYNTLCSPVFIFLNRFSWLKIHFLFIPWAQWCFCSKWHRCRWVALTFDGNYNIRQKIHPRSQRHPTEILSFSPETSLSSLYGLIIVTLSTIKKIIH